MTFPVSFTTSLAGLKKVLPRRDIPNNDKTTSDLPTAPNHDHASPPARMITNAHEETCSLPVIKPSEIMEIADHPCLAHITNPNLPRTSDLGDALAQIARQDAAALPSPPLSSPPPRSPPPPVAVTNVCVQTSICITITPPPVARTVTHHREAAANIGRGLPTVVEPRTSRRTAIVRAPRRQQGNVATVAAIQHQHRPGRRPLTTVVLGTVLNTAQNDS